jgi:hypothetical protein
MEMYKKLMIIGKKKKKTAATETPLPPFVKRLD